MDRIKKHIHRFRETIIDDNKRLNVQFIWVYAILAVVSAFMSVVNIFTAKYLLMAATLAFSMLSAVNIIIAKYCTGGRVMSSTLLSVEIIMLFIFFIVSGIPEGFSAIWICLLPTSGLLLFQRKRGSALCALMFLIILFFFDTPLGNSFLQYPYTTSFKLRFPMLYIAFFAISFFLETVRAITYDEMCESKRQFKYLYLHDALTGLFNRYGFNEQLDRLIVNNMSVSEMTLMIIDIDYFKNVNDKYGHIIGDMVLKKTADILREKTAGEAEVCRWGGEEFAVLSNKSEASKDAAQAILTAIEEYSFESDGKKFHITVSIGMVTVEKNIKISGTDLVRHTDRCLYRAKELGRNKVVCESYGAGLL